VLLENNQYGSGKQPSRRTVIKGLGAGIATLAIQPVFGEVKPGEKKALPPELKDPTPGKLCYRADNGSSGGAGQP
jgi:hypothetical protein